MDKIWATLKDGLSGSFSHKECLPACVSIGPVIKMISAFRSAVQTSVNRAGNCGGKRILSACDAPALVHYIRPQALIYREVEKSYMVR